MPVLVQLDQKMVLPTSKLFFFATQANLDFSHKLSYVTTIQRSVADAA